MIKVKSYKNADELFADLDRLRIEAVRAFNNCSDKQKALKEGDVFITSVPNYDCDCDLFIFNEIQTLDPDDEREFRYAKDAGYVMVRAWSNACPEGEMGSVHRSKALFKVIDSKKHTAEAVLRAFTGIWSTGGETNGYDIHWINSDGNLEALT
jgi:hypothetical protein